MLSPSGRRDSGVDALRGLALVSMYVAHTAPTGGPAGIFTLSEYLTYPLFAALVGMGVELGTRRPWGAAFVRGCVLIVVGLLLDDLHTNVIGILVYLGVLTWVAHPLARLRTPTVAVVGLVAWAAAVPVRHALLDTRHDLFLHGHLTAIRLLDYVATGDFYQLLSVIGYGAIGIVLLRLTREHGWMVARPRQLAVGAGLMVVSGIYSVVATRGATGMEPYEATYREHVFCLLLVVAVALLVLALAPGLGPITRALAPMGRMTLTLYALQIAYLSLWAHHLRPGVSDDRWSNTALLVVGSLAIAWAWPHVVRREPLRRGPLEGLTSVIVDAHLGARTTPAT